jgi:hypothetical protein
MNGDGLAFADYFEMLSEAGKLAENNSSAQWARFLYNPNLIL